MIEREDWEELREIRDRLSTPGDYWSQERLAREIGIPPGTYARNERGVQRPHRATLTAAKLILEREVKRRNV